MFAMTINYITGTVCTLLLLASCTSKEPSMAKAQPKKAATFLNGVPVVQSWAEGLYHAGGRVIVIGTATSDAMVGTKIEWAGGGWIEVNPKKYKWPTNLEGKRVRAIGGLSYFKEPYDPSKQMVDEMFTLQLESIGPDTDGQK
jgi:hypothetical protein